ncbi:hypothetical protein OCS_00224 [Ophiocordyceps sinensis CO18]|uniref:Uncharacterized protein n=1 Tax=Ophiocordyceps sinensis (strain Co18 / CGMCC 3.14243) TaxID=911162 RepID=T5ANA4_OPHSC|nr:hypothetical protein OCS_00224 [Ophiocordyceps sinensis CO18]
MPLDLANPGRTIHVGVILLGGLTEVLDVGPIDLIHGISKPFVDILPDTLLSAEVKAQALDTEFHWASPRPDAAAAIARHSPRHSLPLTHRASVIAGACIQGHRKG